MGVLAASSGEFLCNTSTESVELNTADFCYSELNV